MLQGGNMETEATIERIIEGTIEEFKVNGIKFTMDGLTKRIGMSKRTLYEIVSSKQELFELMIDRTFADVKSQQKRIFENDQLTLLEKTERLFSIVPAYSDRLDYRRVNEIKYAYPKIYKKIHEYINNDWDRTIKLLEDGMDAGIIRRKNLIILKAILCEAFEKLLDGEFLIRNNITYEIALKEMISIIMEGLVIQER